MISKYFTIEELVPVETITKLGPEKAVWVIDPRLLITLDAIRNKCGVLVVNNWHIGGKRMYSGYRPPGSPNYSQYSQHSFGRAADCLTSGMHVTEVRKYILAHPEEFPYIGGIEMDVPWLHVDVRNNNGRILQFSK